MRAVLPLIFTLLACASQAEVVFNTYGPNGEYGNVGFGISSWPLDKYSQAMQFEPTGSGVLNRFHVTLFNNLRKVQGRFTMWHDNGDKLGDQLGGWLATVDKSSPRTYEILNSDSNAYLQSGRKYWLLIETTESNSEFAWVKNAYDIRGLRATVRNGQWEYLYNYQLPTLKVEVVPEPATLVVLALGGVMFARRTSGRRHSLVR